METDTHALGKFPLFEALESRLLLSVELGGGEAIPVGPLPSPHVVIVDRPPPKGPEDLSIISRGVRRLRDQIAGRKAADPSADVSDLNIRYIHRVSPEGEIEVTVHVEQPTPEAIAALESAGLRIVRSIPTSGYARGWIAYTGIDELAAVDGVLCVCLPAYGIPNTVPSGDTI